MAGAVVGSVFATGFTTSLAASYTGTAGNAYLVVVNSTATPTPSVSNTNGDSWSTIVAVVQDGLGNYYAAYLATGIHGGADTVTVSGLASGTGGNFALIELSGTGAFDAASTIATSGFTASFSVSSVTPAQSGDYALAFVNSSNTISSWSGGFAAAANVAGSNIHLGDQNLVGTGAVTASGNFSAGGTVYHAFTLLFAPPAGGGVTDALVGQAITSSEGAPTTGISYALSGRSITSSEGTATPNVSYALSGQAITSSEGAITAAWSGSAPLAGQTITSAQGTPVPGLSYAASGQSITSTEGTPSFEVDYALLGQSITSAEGIITEQAGGDLTLALSGQLMTATLGTLLPSGADAVVTETPAGRRTRRRMFVEIDGQTFWVRTEAEALALLARAAELAKGAAELAIKRQIVSQVPASAPKIKLAKALRTPAVEAAKREVAQVYRSVSVDYELYRMLSERIAQENDEETLLLL